MKESVEDEPFLSLPVIVVVTAQPVVVLMVVLVVVVVDVVVLESVVVESVVLVVWSVVELVLESVVLESVVLESVLLESVLLESVEPVVVESVVVEPVVVVSVVDVVVSLVVELLVVVLDVVVVVVLVTGGQSPRVQLHGYGVQALDSWLSGYWQRELGDPVEWSSASRSPSHCAAPLNPGGARPKLWTTIGSLVVPAYVDLPEWAEAVG